MTIVDERGRLFGRFNLIDAGVVILVLVLVPLAYAAYLLFRPEPVKIASVEPSRIIVGQTPRIRLHGEHLRPYLRAQVGPAQPHNFLIESPNDGDFVLPPDLPVGSHDLTLFDEVHEVAKLRNAITMTTPPPGPRVNLQLVGAFFGLDEAAARSITAGRKFPNDGSATIEVLDAGSLREDVRRVRSILGTEFIISVPVSGSWQVPATIRAVCLPGGENQNCAVNGTIISPGVTVPVPGGFSFVIDSIRGDMPPTPLTIRVQFTGRPEVIDLIAAGDVDMTPGPGAARIVSLREKQSVSGQISKQVNQSGIVETSSVSERLASVEAIVSLAGDRTPNGVAYRAFTVKPGALFTFETPRYVANGAIVSVAPAAAAATSR